MEGGCTSRAHCFRIWNSSSMKWPSTSDQIGLLRSTMCLLSLSWKSAAAAAACMPWRRHTLTLLYLCFYSGTISMASMANRLLDQLLWWLRFEYIRGIDDHSTSEYIRLFKQVCTPRLANVVCCQRSKQQRLEYKQASRTFDLAASRCRSAPHNSARLLCLFPVFSGAWRPTSNYVRPALLYGLPTDIAQYKCTIFAPYWAMGSNVSL